MSQYAISCLIASIGSFIIGAFIYLKNKEKALNILWALFELSITVWVFSQFVESTTQDARVALFWNRILLYGVTFIPIFFLHFIITFLNLKIKNIVKIIYIIGGIFCILNFTSLMAKEVILKPSFGYYTSPGILYYYLFLFFSLSVIYAFYLIARYFKTLSIIKKEQLKYIIIGSIIGFTCGSGNFLPTFNLPIFPVVNYIFIFCQIPLMYAILEYRLMDIRVLLTRAGIFIFVYSFIFALPIWLGIKTQAWLWAIVLMGVLSPVGIFIYSHLRQQIENVLFREQQRYQEAIKDLARRMTQIRETNELFMEIVAEVYSVVQPQFLGLYIFSAPEKVYMLSRHYLPKDYHFARQISSDSQLITMLSKNKRPMLAESAGYSNLPLETLIVPFFSESELFGFLVLGQKSSKMMYSDSDFVTFDILSSQVSLALENAKHLQELKYSQLELLRQENLKFVSVLVKGLAHEILNPLTPLMHRIEDLEGESLLKLYEVYEKNAQQLGEEESLKFKESLLGLRDSTKSLKNNAQHIHLIVDMLNKMQKGDETTIGPLDLKSFFKDVVPTLALEVEPHLQEGITVNQDIANNIPPIRGNPTLLKQIFINLYKNSCEAMRNSAIKTINISCKLNAQNPKETLIEFSDTGPGIPSVIFSKIFTHGFTTKGTKGSGIGLSQCKAIIEKFGGTINIESKQNQGTKFIIKLPIWTEGKNVS